MVVPVAQIMAVRAGTGRRGGADDGAAAAAAGKRASCDVRDTGEALPFPTWDPDRPQERPTPFSHLCRPVRVSLSEGDLLYLPAGWFHKVRQTCGVEGICVAANYWYVLFVSFLLPLLSSFILVGFRRKEAYGMLRQVRHGFPRIIVPAYRVCKEHRFAC